jgi:hypothetical protein
MGHIRFFVWFSLVAFALAMLLPATPVWSQAKTPEKEKVKEKEPEDSIEWTKVIDVTAKAPGNGATYVGSKEFKTDEKAIRVKAKLSSASGKGGTMVMTLYKLGKPQKKIPLMKQSRDGEKEVTLAIEPGEYKLEISVSNVDATATVETGKKK